MLPLPRTLAEWLGVVGGFSFALNNVMLRREAARARGGARAGDVRRRRRSSPARSLALLTLGGTAGWPPPPALPRLGRAGAARWRAPFLAGNLALQYGAARLPANVTAVVMLTEVLFASPSAVALGGGTISGGSRSAARSSSPAPSSPRATPGRPAPG